MLELKIPDPMDLPDIVLTAQGNLAQTQLVTAENVRYVLDSIGFGVRFNVLSAEMEYTHPEAGAGAEWQSHLEMQLLDMCTRLRMKNLERIRDIVGVLAQEHSYHPMEDWLRGLEDDGGDHIAALAATVTTDHPLWGVYLENWLVQVVQGVCGWREARSKSLPYVLTLVGGQGIGKTHWLGTLGARWIKTEAELHLGSNAGKDHQIEALKYPMVELAELDGIFRKADISHLKAFISRTEDAIRVPYARAALVRPRMTAFCASVNTAEFLSDSSGSRRYWPVWVDAIDWGTDVSMDKVWAQALALWEEDPKFDLSAEDNAAREAVAIDQHTVVAEEEEKLRAYVDTHKGNSAFPERVMSRSDIKDMLFGTRLFGNAQWLGLGRCLISLLGKHRTIEGKQRSWLFPYNEFALDYHTWPDKKVLNIVRNEDE